MSIIVSNCQHCDEQQFQTLSCVHYNDFLTNKIRFIHTSTVTGSYSCSRKDYAYASRTSCFLEYKEGGGGKNSTLYCNHQHLAVTAEIDIFKPQFQLKVRQAQQVIFENVHKI